MNPVTPKSEIEQQIQRAAALSLLPRVVVTQFSDSPEPIDASVRLAHDATADSDGWYTASIRLVGTRLPAAFGRQAEHEDPFELYAAPGVTEAIPITLRLVEDRDGLALEALVPACNYYPHEQRTVIRPSASENTPIVLGLGAARAAYEGR